ncbi:hypothetical protein EIP91_006966 [Steccherinum ochraceum]|uniref:BTB domain-containing protein n=1 Tax=Steccherinum ochraceum TaxID=92696 RepID=A0A4R0RJA6_9APHY|nr:hypothetical protein EIP91_006966 [Steccherinum ochraceum]
MAFTREIQTSLRADFMSSFKDQAANFTISKLPWFSASDAPKNGGEDELESSLTLSIPSGSGTMDPNTLIKSADVWFPDGSVVLRASDTLFRAYSGILALHSSVFKDLFTLPQPLDDSESFDECPLIALQDGEEELRDFLRVVHDWSYLYSVSNDLSVLLNLLRMSTKYDVIPLRARVIQLLATHFPRDPLQHPYLPPTSSYPLLFPLPKDVQLTIRAANIFRETNALSLIPAALFACCGLSPDSLLGPRAVPDASNSNPTTTSPFGNDTLNTHSHSLSPENLYTVLKARSTLILFTRQHIFGYAFTPRDPPTCLTPAICRLARADWAEPINKATSRPGEQDGWINPLSPGTYLACMTRVACRRCVVELRESFEKGRKELWEGLPGVFGLDPWERLSVVDVGEENVIA